MPLKKAPLVLTVATLLPLTLTTQALAQDRWRTSLESGLLLSSGNTKEQTITGRLNTLRETGSWRHNLRLETRVTEKDESTTAERYTGSWQTDYRFNPHDFVFGRVRYDRDRFSGYDFQASSAAGYGRRVWNGQDNYLDLSAGLGYRYNRLAEADDQGSRRREDPIGRLAASFLYQLSPSAEFSQELETEIGLDDGESASRSITSLSMDVIGALAMKASYTVEHETDVPEGIKKTDTITSLTLLYSF